MTKTKSKIDSTEKLLTDTELELMTILWAIKEGSVAEVLKELPPDKPLAYTSVSTILRILEQKGILKTRKEGRGHIYIPICDKTTYEAKSVKHLVNRVFAGTPTALVRQLVSSIPLNEKQLNEIKQIIAAAESKK